MDRRSSLDDLARFMAATCEPAADLGVPLSDLVARFNRWSGNFRALSTGCSVRPARMQARRMTVMLRRLGYPVMVVRYGDQVRRSLIGFALRDARKAA